MSDTPPRFDVPLSDADLESKFSAPSEQPKRVPHFSQPPSKGQSSPNGTLRPPKGESRGSGVPSPAPRGRVSTLEKKLEQTYTTLGGAVCMFDITCGTVIVEASHEMAVALNAYAEVNPKVKRALLSLLEKTAFGTVMVAHMPFVMIIAVHHTPLALILGRRAGIEDAAAARMFGEGMVNQMIVGLRANAPNDND